MIPTIAIVHSLRKVKLSADDRSKLTLIESLLTERSGCSDGQRRWVEKLALKHGTMPDDTTPSKKETARVTRAPEFIGGFSAGAIDCKPPPRRNTGAPR